MASESRGSFIVHVRRRKQSYCFLVRDVRTGREQKLVGLSALEHYLDQVLKKGLR
jgi:hypothetical protein